MRNIAAGLALLSLALCSSCGTIITHCHHDESNYPSLQTGTYRGVRADAGLLGEMGNMGPGNIIEIPIMVDLPLSAVADTFMHPLDLRKDGERANEDRARYDAIRKQDQSKKWVPIQGNSDSSKWDEDVRKPQ